MNENEQRLLLRLNTAWTRADDAATQTGLPLDTVMSVASSLEAQGFLQTQRQTQSSCQRTPEGERYAKTGLPERRLADAVAHAQSASLEDAYTQAGLDASERGIALAWAKKKNWVQIAKGPQGPVLTAAHKPAASDAERALTQPNPAPVPELVERKLVSVTDVKTVFFKITPAGEKAALAAHAQPQSVGPLTPAMLRDGSWRNATFRAYDVNTVAAPVQGGRRQHYERFLDRIRESLVGLGFSEAHGPLVETEFWNLDTLFMAQNHPAREVHDIYFAKHPSTGDLPDADLVERVRKAHQEGGGTGSKGWRYHWSDGVAKRLVLRSQTTAVSARELAKPFTPPVRRFCIGRVFRPDELDWKHLLEFEQCEGIVADEGLNFRQLVGYLKTFAYDVIGAEDARILPHYYPFTEPSADLAVKMPGKGWMEVGGAGMFRPELLEALGVHVPVLAWGLGIGRLALVAGGLQDIRQLYSDDVDFLRRA